MNVFSTPARRLAQPAALAGAIVLLPGIAQAYVGPGAGLTAIGTMIALIAAVLLAVVGFVWYPLKRLMNRGTAPADHADDAPTLPASADDPR